MLNMEPDDRESLLSDFPLAAGFILHVFQFNCSGTESLSLQ